MLGSHAGTKLLSSTIEATTVSVYFAAPRRPRTLAFLPSWSVDLNGMFRSSTKCEIKFGEECILPLLTIAVSALEAKNGCR